MAWSVAISWSAACMVLAMAVEPVPADVNFDMRGGEKTFVVKPGDIFKVKIVDMASTGYQWFLMKKPDGLRLGNGGEDGVHGGGQTEPPFLMWEMMVPSNFTAGTVSWEHARPWERNKPDAVKGYAVLRLTTAAYKGEDSTQMDDVRGSAADSVPADVNFDMTGGEETFVVKPGEPFKVKIVDMTSTGYHWYLLKTPEGLRLGNGGEAGVSGGGQTEPPFLMWEMMVPSDFTAGTVSWEHVKPWERNDPKADRGYAKLDLTTKAYAPMIMV